MARNEPHTPKCRPKHKRGEGEGEKEKVAFKDEKKRGYGLSLSPLSIIPPSAWGPSFFFFLFSFTLFLCHILWRFSSVNLVGCKGYDLLCH